MRFLGYYGWPESVRTVKNYGETAILAGASLVAATPWTFGIGGGVALGLNYVQRKIGGRFLEENLAQHPKSHEYSPNLQKMVDRLYKISGLNVDKNPVYDFRPSPLSKRKKNWESVLGEVFEQAAAVPNAAASNVNRPVIIISEPLLQLLTDEEEYAVLAHEFVHAGAQHQKATWPKTILAMTAAVSNSILSFVEYIQAGFFGVLASIGAASLVSSMFKTRPKDARLEIDSFSSAELLSEKTIDLTRAALNNVGMANVPAIANLLKRLDNASQTAKTEEKAKTPEELLVRKRAKLRQKFATQMAAAGTASWFNPAYLPVYAAVRTVNTALTLSNQRLSRIFEYHADKAAVVKFESNPLALITSLRKITTLVERSQRNANGFSMSDVKVSKMGRAWAQMKATHPPVPKRAQELAKLAKKLGYSEEAIHAAVHGPLDLGNTPDIPLEMAEKAAKMLHIEDHLHPGLASA